MWCKAVPDWLLSPTLKHWPGCLVPSSGRCCSSLCSSSLDSTVRWVFIYLRIGRVEETSIFKMSVYNIDHRNSKKTPLIFLMSIKFALLENFLTGISDAVPSLRRHKMAFTVGTGVCCFILGLPFVTRVCIVEDGNWWCLVPNHWLDTVQSSFKYYPEIQLQCYYCIIHIHNYSNYSNDGNPLTSNCLQGGQYVLEVMDKYGGSTALIFIAICECIAISWIYGYKNIAADIHFMLDKKLGIYWKCTWRYTAPAVLVVRN